MADVEGSDGNNYTIPDFALEDTQEKILAVMKKQFKLTDSDLKNAQKALSNDNKNSQAQIDALNKLGGDIKSAVDGKGTFFGGLKDSAAGTMGVLTSFTKGVGTAVGVMGTLGVAATAAALSLTKGFGDQIAGLATSGAAFGDLGRELGPTIIQLRTMGLTMGEAVNAVENFRVSMTVLGAKGTTDVIKSFQDITNMGSDYGRTISENIEFLAEEIQTRQMLGFFQRRTAEEEAASAKELMDSQLAASKLLGKSVDDIAQSVKQLFGRDDFKASFARMGEDAAETLRKTFQTFEGAELGDGMMEGLAKAFTDPIMMQSEEARQSLSALRLIDPQAADEIQRNIQGFRDATARGDTAAAEQFAKEAERLTLQTTAQIADMSEQDKRRLELQGQSNAALAGTLANQNAIKEGFENYGKEQEMSLNSAIRNSTNFDNIIQLLSNSFGTLYTAVQNGIAPALQSFTDAFGRMEDSNSPIKKFQLRLSEIGAKISDSFERIFGASSKLGGEGGAIPLVNGLLDTLASVIDTTATNILGFVESLMDPSGGSFMDKIGKFVGDMFADLVGIIGEQVRQIDIMDVLFGESESEITDSAAKRVEATKERRRGNQTEEQKSEGLMRALSDVIEYRDDKNEKKAGSVDAEKMLEMVTKAGVDIQELTGEHLLQLFPDATELRDAITATYGDGATEAFAKVTGKIVEHTEAERKALEGGLGSLLRKDSYTNELQAEQDAIKKDFLDTLLPEVEVTAKKRSEKIEEPKTLEGGTQEEILANVAKETGTPPSQQSSASIIKDPESAEPTTPGPVSQDGTPTQEVKPAVTSDDNQENANKTLEELMVMQMNVLTDIRKNTGRTVSGIGSLRNEI
jgi:hypothetical protein